LNNTDPILEIVDVSKSFPKRRSIKEIARRIEAPRLVALDAVSMAVPAHGTLGIVGESGSGKSTLARSIVRLVEPDSGVIRFDGKDLLRADRKQLTAARRRVQMIYQDPYSSLNPRLTVGETIIEPARVHGLVDRQNETARLASLLDQVGLSQKLADRRPRALSGGQRQRVAIARALATEPDLLIADEAVSALDLSIQAQVVNLLTDLQSELGLTMIFISHQLSVVAHIADEIAVMYLGRVVEHGPTAALFSSPAHPYTAALIEAQPRRDKSARHNPAIAGEIPSSLDIPEGCNFRSRCALAQPICAQVDPPEVRLASGQSSWCHVLPVERVAGTPLEPTAAAGTDPVDKSART
jgi:oligopeptide/dipeptide ABC transporter ATP-binding protein